MENRLYRLGRQHIPITQNTKTLTAKHDILTGNRKTKNWGKTGVGTAGFYSKHVIWHKPTIEASVKDLNQRYKDIDV